MKVERLFDFNSLSHLEGVCRCVLGVGILYRGDVVVTFARARHCDGTNRDGNGNEVEKGRKETVRGVRGVLIQCVV